MAKIPGIRKVYEDDEPLKVKYEAGPPSVRFEFRQKVWELIRGKSSKAMPALAVAHLFKRAKNWQFTDDKTNRVEHGLKVIELVEKEK